MRNLRVAMDEYKLAHNQYPAKITDLTFDFTNTKFNLNSSSDYLESPFFAIYINSGSDLNGYVYAVPRHNACRSSGYAIAKQKCFALLYSPAGRLTCRTGDENDGTGATCAQIGM
jgi:hypothetical protein